MTLLANITHVGPNGTDTSDLTDGQVLTQTFSGPGTHTITVSAQAALSAGERLELTVARRTADGVPVPAPLTLVEAPDKYRALDIDGFNTVFVWCTPDGTDTPLTFVGENPQAGEWTYNQAADGVNTYIIPSLGAGEPYVVYAPRPASGS